MPDTFSVTAALAAGTPALASGTGQPFTIAITGADVLTTVTNETVNVSLSIKAKDGATEVIKAVVPMTKTVTAQESAVIVSATDDEGTGRVYAVSADGLSVLAYS